MSKQLTLVGATTQEISEGARVLFSSITRINSHTSLIRAINAQLAKKQLCWACSLGKCGQGPFDNTCTCCRNNHM